jgi:hypothetical protein
MGPSPAELVRSTVAGSALLAKYGTAVDNVSAYEKLTGKAGASTGAAAPGQPPAPAPEVFVPGNPDQAAIDDEARRIEEEILGRPSSRQPGDWQPGSSWPSGGRAGAEDLPAPPAKRRTPPSGGMMEDISGALGGVLGSGLKSMARSMGTQLGRELLRGVFGTSSRRRR